MALDLGLSNGSKVTSNSQGAFATDSMGVHNLAPDPFFYNVTKFASSPVGASQPDSIDVYGDKVFIGYGNGTKSDGSDGKPTTIAEYTNKGQLVNTFSVPGHNDGLRVDSSSGKVFALLNQDGNPRLTIIDTTTSDQQTYTLPSINGGGGYDDIRFLNGETFLSASGPSLDSNGVNTNPVIGTLTISDSQATVTPVFSSSASLNITDPDSLGTTPTGALVLEGGDDQKQLRITNSGTEQQASLIVSHQGITLDDTVFAPSTPGSSLLVADTSGNAVYKISGNFTPGEAYTSSTNKGFVGSINSEDGSITPLVTGLKSPHGLAFLPNSNDYSVSEFAANPVGASKPDSAVVYGDKVFIGYGNGTKSDGSDGKPTTIAEYTNKGQLINTFSVPGHNDGLGVDPASGKVFALLNQDGNPKLTVIDTTTSNQQTYTLPSINGGGGYDDIRFLNGQIFLSASAPTLDSNGVNTNPVIGTLTFSDSQATITPVFSSSASLNIKDPDSLGTTPTGALILEDQDGQKQIRITNPGTELQQASLILPHSGITLDDTAIAPETSSRLLVSDDTLGVVYQISGNFTPGTAYTASSNKGFVGTINSEDGTISPLVSGFKSPHGLTFVSNSYS